MKWTKSSESQCQRLIWRFLFAPVRLFFAWWNGSWYWWRMCCIWFRTAPKRIPLFYKLDIVTIAEPFLVLNKTKHNTFSINQKNHFNHAENHLIIKMVLWVFMVLYRTIFFTKEPLKKQLFWKLYWIEWHVPNEFQQITLKWVLINLTDHF